VTDGCEFFKGRRLKRQCDCCAGPLVGRQQRWCSSECSDLFWNNHGWKTARHAALERDKFTCQNCGAVEPGPAHDGYGLEVNHIEPRMGLGYANGCHHHQNNLETLCIPCHAKVTAQQRKSRAHLPRTRYWIIHFRMEGRDPKYYWERGVARHQLIYASLTVVASEVGRRIAHNDSLDNPCRMKGEYVVAPVLLCEHEVMQRGDELISRVMKHATEMPAAPIETFALMNEVAS